MGTTKVSMVGTLPPLKGISPYCAELSACLSRYVDIEFMTFKRLYPEKLYPGGTRESDLYPPIPFLDEEKLEVRECIDFYNPLSWLRSGLNAKGEVVHAQWWSGFLAPVYYAILGIARMRRKRIIITVHNIEPHEGGIPYALLNRGILRLGHEFVVHNEKNREKLLRMMRGAPKPVHVIPHIPFVAAYETNGSESKESARKHLGIGYGDTVLLFFGNIRDYKGLDVLLRALPSVDRLRPGTKLIVAGQPWVEWGRYQNIIEEENISENVITRLGYLPFPELKQLIAACDLAVFPFKKLDSASGSVTLARSLGKPVVVSEACPLDEQPGNDVFFSKTGCPSSLAETIAEALAVLETLRPDNEKDTPKRLLEERDHIALRHMEIYGLKDVDSGTDQDSGSLQRGGAASPRAAVCPMDLSATRAKSRPSPPLVHPSRRRVLPSLRDR